jgi:GNAT superfamily N-acetyltransferase
MTDQVSLRLARLGERHTLEELQRRASLMWEEDREALLANPDAIDLPDDHIAEKRTIGAEALGETLGFAVILPGAEQSAELDGVFVEPRVWRQGIGRSLVTAAQKLAWTQGARSVLVTANLRAKGFYFACGFVPIGTVATRFGVGLRCARTASPRSVRRRRGSVRSR